MTTQKKTLTGLVPIVADPGEMVRQIGPVCESAQHARQWAERAVETDHDLRGARIYLAKATVTFEVIGIPV